MLIHELVSTKILPAIRGIIAHRLVERGISQRKISLYLEVTQPMISKILKKPIDQYYGELERLKLTRDIIDHYVEILIDIIDENDYEKYISTCFYVINHLALKALCNTRTHLSKICITGEYREPEIEYYKSILSRLLSIRGLEKLIPEVGSNLAYSPSTPQSISDIIGLTGRIVKTDTGVIYHGEPIYGGSKHVAKILLLAARVEPDMRFCFNIRCDRRIRDVLTRLDLIVVDTGPHTSEEEFWLNIENAISRLRPRIICDHGGIGLEPITYILAYRFTELESIIRHIVAEMSS